MIATANENGQTLKVLTAVDAENDDQKCVLPNKIKSRFGGDLKGKHFALWSLTFKPNTDDMREALSLSIVADLIVAGATITAYDPVAMHEVQR